MTYTNTLEEFDLTNPYRVMRMEARKTQQYLADICDVEEQYIRRLEQGLVNTATDGVSRELLDMLPSSYITAGRNIGEKIEYISNWYSGWQRVKREKMGRLVEEDLPECTMSPMDFRHWVMSWLVEDGSEQNVNEIRDKSSVYAFCRAFSLHPATVQRWEKVGGPMPPTIRVAMGQANIAVDQVTFRRN